MSNLDNIWVAKAYRYDSSSSASGDVFYFLMHAYSVNACQALIQQYVAHHPQRISLPLAPLRVALWRERHEPLPEVESYLDRLDENNASLITFQPQPEAILRSDQNYLHVETFDCDPLEEDIWQSLDARENAPTAIKAHLWPDENSHCYVILDCSKHDRLESLIESSGCVYRCLYQGLSYERFSYMAPYLLELPRDEPEMADRYARNHFLRSLFTHAPDSPLDLWSRNVSTFLVSNQDFDTVYQHARKFIHMKTPDARWIYFHYFQAPTMANYLGGNARRAAKLAAFFGHPTRLIEQVITLKNGTATLFWPENLEESLQPAKIELDEQDMRPIIDHYNRHALFPPLAEAIKAKNPAHTTGREPAQIVQMMMETAAELRSYGLSESRSVHLITLWKLFFGNDWYKRDPQGRLEQILNTPNLAEKDKKHALIRRMKALEAV